MVLGHRLLHGGSRASASFLVLLFTLLCVLSSVHPASSSSSPTLQKTKIIGNNNVQQAPFNYTLAYNQLMLSYSAYCPKDQVGNWTCYFCKNNSDVASFVPVATLTNETTNTFGYVGYHSGTIVEVVFRGTVSSSLKNWITDLDAGHSSLYQFIPGALVYTGFLDAWYSIKAQVVAAVQEVYTQIKPTEFYFTGHSLGAALSVLAAIEIGIESGLPITCYNFGDPRVGNTVFAEYFDSNIQTSWRLVNQRDIVPHLPGKEFGFWHIATEVWWNTSTHYMICNDSGEDPSCSDSLGILADSIPDHLDYLSVPLHDGRPSGCM